MILPVTTSHGSDIAGRIITSYQNNNNASITSLCSAGNIHPRLHQQQNHCHIISCVQCSFSNTGKWIWIMNRPIPAISLSANERIQFYAHADYTEAAREEGQMRNHVCTHLQQISNGWSHLMTLMVLIKYNFEFKAPCKVVLFGPCFRIPFLFF